MNIAKLTKTENGDLRGQLKTLTLDVALHFRANSTGADYSVFVEGGDSEIGAAFLKEAKGTGKPFYSVRIDDPAFVAPINCALFEDKRAPNTFNLVFNRPKPRDADAEN